MFCTNCGSKLETGQQFCTQCGTRVSSNDNIINAGNNNYNNDNTYHQPAQSPQATPVWVMGASKTLSFLNIISCYVIFYNDRLLVAHITPEFQKAESAKKSAEIKASNIGFFKGSAEMMRFWADYYKKYYTMSQQAILSETHLNIEITYNMVSEVKFHAFEQGSDDDPDSGGYIHISVSNGQVLKLKHKISHSSSVKSTLESLFGYRLKYKR